MFVLFPQLNKFGEPKLFIFALLMGTVENIGLMFCLAFAAWMVRVWAGVLFIVSGIASFFIKNLGIEITKPIIESVFGTYPQEAADLMSVDLAAHLLLYAGIPIVLTFFLRIKKEPFLKRLKIFFITVTLMIPFYLVPHLMDPKSLIFAGKKLVEPYFVPTSLYRNTYGFLKKRVLKGSIALEQRQRIEEVYAFEFDRQPKDMTFVLVIGESTRGDHLSLNGYERTTTPKLEKRSNLVSYTDATSCSARTIFSVACLLSHKTLSTFLMPLSDTSVISVMKSLGFKTYFISNHRKKGRSNCEEADVCFMQAEKNKALGNTKQAKYDLALLDLMASPTEEEGNKFIVLHTIGSHSNYNDRIPDESYRKFRPTCERASLYRCESDELVNSYDNSILYVDTVLDSLMERLEDKNAFVLYTSDHGESLGEKGVYLHSKPNFLAPSEQRDIPMRLWKSKAARITEDHAQRIKKKTLDEPVTHDHVFHTILDCSGVRGEIVDKKLSLCN